MNETHVVTCFIEYESKILLLKRSNQVGSYQQRWAGVSGHIEAGNSPLEQALQELGEEVGLQASDLSLVKEGAPLEVVDAGLNKKWVVHPFRFLLSSSNNITIDWEHTECRWVHPEEIKNYTTVPNLDQTWLRVI